MPMNQQQLCQFRRQQAGDDMCPYKPFAELAHQLDLLQGLPFPQEPTARYHIQGA